MCLFTTIVNESTVLKLAIGECHLLIIHNVNLSFFSLFRDVSLDIESTTSSSSSPTALDDSADSSTDTADEGQSQMTPTSPVASYVTDDQHSDVSSSGGSFNKSFQMVLQPQPRPDGLTTAEMLRLLRGESPDVKIGRRIPITKTMLSSVV